jgi:fructuronate reductase
MVQHPEIVPLNLSTAASLPASIARPAYDRTRLATGIVHLGLGSFHRAHQALYTEAAIAQGDRRWGIAGVHLRGRGAGVALAAQDHLYTVTERHAGHAATRLVGVLRSVLDAPSSLPAVLALLADPGVAVVTSTVTEKGYSLHTASGELDLGDPDLRHDLATPRAPRSTLGVLAEGLRRRGGAPLTIVCCDNMSANGDTVRRLLLQYAEQVDAGLARRIAATVAFPNTMVDRIVPAPTAQSLAWAEARLGLRDESAVVCEPFTQWVIEDRFAGPRPAWEAGGALLTSDVRPYQAMKLALLNGTHSVIAYLGQLRGIETVDAVMSDPLLAPFVRRAMAEDLLGSLDIPPGYDAPAYCRDLLHRFENPALGHRTAQIASDGTLKVPVRWLPALRHGASRGIERPALERALAAWLRYLEAGCDDGGRPLAVADPGAERLAQRLRAARDARAALAAALDIHVIFGPEPWPEPWLGRVATHLDVLRRGGTDALLAPD